MKLAGDAGLGAIRWSIYFLTAFITGCANPLGELSKQASTFHPGLLSGFKIESVSPSSGAYRGGTSITVRGAGFLPGASVTIGDVACLNPTWVSDQRITCVTPGHQAGTVAVTVTNADSRTATLQTGFEFLGNPSSTTRIGVASSGGIASGPGVKLRLTLGGTGNPIQPSGAGVRARLGVQGVLAQP